MSTDPHAAHARFPTSQLRIQGPSEDLGGPPREINHDAQFTIARLYGFQVGRLRPTSIHSRRRATQAAIDANDIVAQGL